MSAYGTEDVYLLKQATPGSLAARLAIALLAMKMTQDFHRGLRQNLADSEAANDRANQVNMAQMAPAIRAARYSRPPILLNPRIYGSPDPEYDAAVNFGAFPGGPPLQGPNPMPLGWDQGMVRMASATLSEVASDMAKTAGPLTFLKGLASRGPRPSAPSIPGGAGSALRAPAAAPKTVFQAPAPGAMPTTPTPTPKPAAGQLAAPAPAAAAGAAAKPAAAAGKAEKSIWSGFAKGGWKTRVPLMLGMGAAAYGAHKLLSGTAQAMSRETPEADWGNTQHGAARLPYGVNRWGQAQVGTPFVM